MLEIILSNSAFAEIKFEIGSITIYLVQILIFVISVALMMVLSFWLSKTKAGKALRATAENLETASILGVNTKEDYLINGRYCISSWWNCRDFGWYGI